MNATVIQNIILIAVPCMSGLIWLCYKHPAKARVLLNRIYLAIGLTLACIVLVLFIIGMTLMHTERIIKNQDDIKILSDSADFITPYIYGFSLSIIILIGVFYLLKQLSIYFEVDENKPGDTNSV